MKKQLKSRVIGSPKSTLVGLGVLAFLSLAAYRDPSVWQHVDAYLALAVGLAGLALKEKA